MLNFVHDSAENIKGCYHLLVDKRVRLPAGWSGFWAKHWVRAEDIRIFWQELFEKGFRHGLDAEHVNNELVAQV
jgi:hypothetical protein